MDLVATIRKEGTRGGRGEFSWEDVKNSEHRDHYLGHSVMAPVGRWQTGKDLNWYSKGGDTAEDEEARNNEVRKVKRAEEDAMARALGLPPPSFSAPNVTPSDDPRRRDGDAPDARSDRRREHDEHRRHKHHHRSRRHRSRSRSRDDRRRDSRHRERSRSPRSRSPKRRRDGHRDEHRDRRQDRYRDDRYGRDDRDDRRSHRERDTHRRRSRSRHGRRD